MSVLLDLNKPRIQCIWCRTLNLSQDTYWKSLCLQASPKTLPPDPTWWIKHYCNVSGDNKSPGAEDIQGTKFKVFIFCIPFLMCSVFVITWICFHTAPCRTTVDATICNSIPFADYSDFFLSTRSLLLLAQLSSLSRCIPTFLLLNWILCVLCMFIFKKYLWLKHWKQTEIYQLLP